MAAAIGSLVLVQTDGAAACANGAGPYNDVVDAIERQIATEQRRIELVGLEGDDSLYGVVLGGMKRIPAEIGADIDEDTPWRCGQVLGYPLGQQRLVGAVFGDVPADDVASIHEEGQFRLLGPSAKRRTPGREPSQQKKQCSDRTDETNHARRHLPLANVRLITLRSLVSAAVLNGARRSCLGESGQKVGRRIP